MRSYDGEGWRLIHGEALRVLTELPDASVDAIITDPPYSSGGFTRGDRLGSTSDKYVQTGTMVDRPDFAGDTRDQRSFVAWCAVWMAEALRVAKPGAILATFADWRQLPCTTDAVQAGGWVWRGIAPWRKPGARPTQGRPTNECEYIVWATAGSRALAGSPFPGWYEVGVKQSDKHHLTGKPTELMRRLVALAPPLGLVLDPFAGSGTTGVAALLEGRRFLGVELTDTYAAIAANRLAEAEAVRPLFVAETAAVQAGIFDE